MLELYIPRKYTRHEEVAHNVKHSNVSLPNLNAKYVAEILDWQSNFPKINDPFHLKNHNTAKKSIDRHKYKIQLANNNVSPKIQDSNWNKKDQPSKNDSIAGKKKIFNYNFQPFHIKVPFYTFI